MFRRIFADLGTEDVAVEELVATESVLFQNRMTEGKDKERAGLLATDRAMTADLVVKTGDAFFIKCSKQDQVATAWSKAEAVQLVEDVVGRAIGSEERQFMLLKAWIVSHANVPSAMENHQFATLFSSSQHKADAFVFLQKTQQHRLSLFNSLPVEWGC